MNARFQLKNTDACNAYYQADYVSAPMGPAVNFMNNLSLSLISVSGALLYLFGGRFTLTLGELSSFVLYSRKFSGPINELANVISELQSSLAAAERVFVLLDTRPEPEDAADAKELHIHEGAVAMEHIHFGYQPEKPIIHDLSLKAAGGSLTAIVGPTGAGKTTLINLLMRFYDPTGNTKEPASGLCHGFTGYLAFYGNDPGKYRLWASGSNLRTGGRGCKGSAYPRIHQFSATGL